MKRAVTCYSYIKCSKKCFKAAWDYDVIPCVKYGVESREPPLDIFFIIIIFPKTPEKNEQGIKAIEIKLK